MVFWGGFFGHTLVGLNYYVLTYLIQNNAYIKLRSKVYIHLAKSAKC